MKPRAPLLLAISVLLGASQTAWGAPIIGFINAQYSSPPGYGYSYVLGTKAWPLGPTSSGATLAGTVSGLSFGTPADPATGVGSWLEIGFVATNRGPSATPPAWLPYPGMFNQSAFLAAYLNGAGHLLVMPADSDMRWSTAGGPGSGGAANGTWFDLGTGVSDFGFVLSILPDGIGPSGTIVLRVDGQAGTRSWQYGYCNWRWYGYNTGKFTTIPQVEFDTSWQNAYAVAQGYTNDAGGSVQAEVSMDVVPEPTFLLLLCTGFGAVAAAARRRGRG